MYWWGLEPASQDHDISTPTTTLLSYTKALGQTGTDALDTQNLHHHGCPTT